MNVCGRGVHEIRGPADRLPNGSCRHCDRDRQRSYRERRKLAVALLRQMESAGLKEADLTPGDGYAIALKWASTADAHELAKIEAEHPTLIDKLRRRMDRLEVGR